MLFFAEYKDQIRPGKIAVVGAPFDQNSSFLRGAAQAPPLIRKALFSYSANLFTESELDLAHSLAWLDVGDLTFTAETAALAEIEEAATELLSRQMRVITLGGDHSITYPLIRAHAKSYPNLSILQLDAHPDLYDDLEVAIIVHHGHIARCAATRSCINTCGKSD